MITAESADDFARQCISIVRRAEVGRHFRENAERTIWQKREWYFAKYNEAPDKRVFLRSMPVLCQVIE